MTISLDDFEKLGLEVNGLRFNALAKGPKEGKLVLFLHGFPQFADSWAPVMRPLAAAGYRTLAVDQRGYSPGARPRYVREYAVENLVSDTLGFADALGVRTFHLVGHDWGGLLGWRLAADHPERLLSLTVLSTPHKDALLDALRSDADQKWRSRYIPVFRIPGRVAEALLKSGKPQRLRTIYQGKIDKAAVSENVRRLSEPYALTAALNWYRAMNLERRIGKVAVPVLYVWGSEDIALGRTAAERTASYVAGPYRFELLEGKSHWLIEEVPDQISELLLQHLAANSEPTRQPVFSESKQKLMPEVVLFDLNGTLLDTAALAPVLRKIFGRKLSVREWFTQVIAYSMASTLAGDYRQFGDIAIAVLKMEANARQIELSGADVEKVQEAMRRLPAFADVKPSLRKLRKATVRLSVLSNSAPASMNQQLRNAGLDGYFESTTSVDAVERFKPSPETYQAAAKSLNVETANILMVAAHPWDLLGAARAGCRTALLAREEKSTLPGAPPAEFVAADMGDLADQILAKAQHRPGRKILAVTGGAVTLGILGSMLFHSRTKTASALRDSRFPENAE